MKNLIKIFPLVCFLFIGINSASAQKVNKKKVTETFEVRGVCSNCEQRIEKAALIKGVKYAQWDRDGQSIKVIYNPSKVDHDAIEKAISAVGHDTQNTKATDEVYNALPECCSYRDGIAPH